MTDDLLKRDLLKRADRALLPAAPRQVLPPGPLLNRGNKLLARANAVIEGGTAKALAASPLAKTPPKPAPELARLPGMCSATGGWFVLIMERRGNELVRVGHEKMPRMRQGGDHRPAALLSGEYEINLGESWACPLCRASESWICNCRNFTGAFHCTGTEDGRHHCACGKFEQRFFVPKKTFQVRGASVAATPDARSRHEQQQPQLKQVSYERNR